MFAISTAHSVPHNLVRFNVTTEELKEAGQDSALEGEAAQTEASYLPVGYRFLARGSTQCAGMWAASVVAGSRWVVETSGVSEITSVSSIGASDPTAVANFLFPP